MERENPPRFAAGLSCKFSSIKKHLFVILFFGLCLSSAITPVQIF